MLPTCRSPTAASPPKVTRSQLTHTDAVVSQTQPLPVLLPATHYALLHTQHSQATHINNSLSTNPCLPPAVLLFPCCPCPDCCCCCTYTQPLHCGQPQVMRIMCGSLAHTSTTLYPEGLRPLQPRTSHQRAASLARVTPCMSSLQRRQQQQEQRQQLPQRRRRGQVARVCVRSVCVCVCVRRLGVFMFSPLCQTVVCNVLPIFVSLHAHARLCLSWVRACLCACVHMHRALARACALLWTPLLLGVCGCTGCF